MRKSAAVVVIGLLSLVSSGCGGGGGSSDSGSSGTTGTTPMTLVVHDAPSADSSVLSFQIKIQSAVLQPTGMDLLRGKPVTVDLADLATETAFLASTVVNSATYTSITITFAEPQLTIVNNTGKTITTASATCADGATCTFTPTITNATLTISSGVFPITLTADTPAGLDIDVVLTGALQSDYSVSFADSNTVSVSRMPNARVSDKTVAIQGLLGVVNSASSSQLALTNSFGEAVSVITDASTVYDFPASVCSTNGASCLASGQIVNVDMSATGGMGLVANRIVYAAPAGTSVARGTVTSIGSSDALTGLPSSFDMVVHQVVPQDGGSVATAGNVVDVAVNPGAVYSVGPASYPAISGGSFASAADLLVGQDIQARSAAASTSSSVSDTLNAVVATLVPTSAPIAAYPTDSLVLQSSQVTGTVDTVSGDGFTIGALARFYRNASPAITGFQVKTDASTQYVTAGDTTLIGITAGQRASVKGPIFNTDAGGPSIGATAVRTH